MDKPVPRLGVNMDFGERGLAHSVLVDAKDQMLIGGLGVALAQLVGCEIPMGVEPMRIARDQEQLPCAVGVGERLVQCFRRRP